MSAAKMKPATALPFAVFEDQQWRTPVIASQNYVVGDETDCPIAQLFGGNFVEVQQDAAYIVHACNEYPRLMDERAQLVTALRRMIACHGGDEQWWETEGEHRFQNQIDNLNLPRPTADVIRQQITDETRALLRSIGEEV